MRRWSGREGRRVAIAVVAAIACGAASADEGADPASRRQDLADVKVLVLNFDPIVRREGGIRRHQEAGWQAPRVLAKGYAEDVERASRGEVKYRVVEWRDLDEFPVKADGFTYDLEAYERCRKANKGWHQPDMADYPAVIAKSG